MGKVLETLRDNTFKIIGYIEEKDCEPGTLLIRNEKFQILGYYYSKRNQTWTVTGRLLGEGNLLGLLAGRNLEDL